MRDTGIYAPAVQNRQDFQSWKEVSENFKTRTQWLKAGRRVGDGEQPQARVLYPRIVEASGFPYWDESVLEQYDEFVLVTDPPTHLFHFDQTVAYNASSRTKAYEAFEEIFLRHSRKDSFGRKTDSATGDELDDWVTITVFPNSQQFQFLNGQLIRQHVNQKQIVGVKGTERTRFLLLDLDYHGRDQAVFEAQAEVLLNALHGRGTWHFQVKRQDVTGLQMICVFAEPVDLQVVTEKLETILRELDQQNPELALKAKAVGMKTLAELEIYPDPNQSVRLPLCRDREMLLDKSLPLVTHRNQQVQDVEGYIRWIEDPNREYMPKEKVLDYLHYFSFPATAPNPSPRKNSLPLPAVVKVGMGI